MKITATQATTLAAFSTTSELTVDAFRQGTDMPYSTARARLVALEKKGLLESYMGSETWGEGRDFRAFELTEAGTDLLEATEAVADAAAESLEALMASVHFHGDPKGKAGLAIAARIAAAHAAKAAAKALLEAVGVAAPVEPVAPVAPKAKKLTAVDHQIAALLTVAAGDHVHLSSKWWGKGLDKGYEISSYTTARKAMAILVEDRQFTDSTTYPKRISAADRAVLLADRAAYVAESKEAASLATTLAALLGTTSGWGEEHGVSDGTVSGCALDLDTLRKLVTKLTK